MKLSVSNWCIQDKMFKENYTVSDFLDMCKKVDVEYVELLDCFFKDEGEYEVASRKLKETGIKLACFSVSNDFIQAKEKDYLQQIAYIKDGIDRAVYFGTDTLRIFIGHMCDGITEDKAYNDIVKGLSQVSKYALDKGITLAIENHGGLIGNSNQLKNVINEVGASNLKVNLDTGNFVLVGETPDKAAKNLDSLVKYVHIKDIELMNQDYSGGFEDLNGLKYEGTIIGEGDINWKALINELRKIGYQGYLTIEYEGVDIDSIEGTLKSIENFRNLL